MNKLFAAVIFLAAFGASFSPIHGQAPGADIESQLRSLFRLTRVGENGVVVGQAGSVLVIQPTATWSAREEGLTALPASSGACWYTTYDKEGGARRATFQHGGAVRVYARVGHRSLQVGEKVYLTDLQVKPIEIAFFVQSCGGCDPSAPDPNNPPYCARLAFEFEKGYLSTADLKQVLEKTGRVLALDASPARQDSQQPTPDRPLKLPCTYAKAQTPSDQLQLNDDHTFSLQENGQMYSGTFTVNGAAVELNIKDGPTSTATRQGDNLIDSSGKVWAPQPPQAAGRPDVLQNQDILKMVQAGLDDATILAKISSSKCHFDTSTDALIQLKQSGVSATVLKAMVGAAR